MKHVSEELHINLGKQYESSCEKAETNHCKHRMSVTRERKERKRERERERERRRERQRETEMQIKQF